MIFAAGGPPAGAGDFNPAAGNPAVARATQPMRMTKPKGAKWSTFKTNSKIINFIII